MAASPPPPPPPSSTPASTTTIWVFIWYLSVLPAVWVAPCVFSCFRHLIRSQGNATSLRLATEASAEAAQLEAAEQARKRLHARVSGAVWQVGWVLMWFGFIVFVITACIRMGAPKAIDVQPIMGSYVLNVAYIHPGFALMFLSIQPIEAARIRSVFIICHAVLFVGSFTALSSVLTFFRVGIVAYAVALIPAVLWGFAVCIFAAYKLNRHRCRGAEPVPARRMLQLMWFHFRSFQAVMGVAVLASGIFRLACLGNICAIPPVDHIITGISHLLTALVSTHANRGRIIRWLGSLGKSGPAEQQAASVASLLGDSSVGEALAEATKRFHSLPLSKLTREALMNNEPDPSLHALTVPATLGKVDAFMSHSWCTPL